MSSQVVERRVISTLRQEFARCLIRTTYRIIASYAEPSDICQAAIENGGENASQPEGDYYKRLYQNYCNGHARFRGKQALLDILSLIKQPGEYDVLVNTREAETLLSIINLYELGEALASHPILRRSRICLLVPTKDIDKAGFFETVAANRGVQIKAFADFEQAITWLVMRNGS